MSQQSDIFSGGELQLGYDELCNALYERELHNIASETSSDARKLKRRLNGLSYLIQRAARVMLHPQGPLVVDTHNASWQNKQAGSCPGLSSSPEQIQNWYQQKTQIGTVVTVYNQEPGCQQIELDSVDRIDNDGNKIHLNKHGWFTFPPSMPQLHTTTKYLLKPNRAAFISACCGHRWDHKLKILPRPLTLREIMLASNIQWSR